MGTKLTTPLVLIVDDEVGISDSLKDYFELEDFHVESASSGNKALEVLRSKKIDLVVSDVRMPDGDGRFLLKSIRKTNPNHPIVIMMSGFSDLSIEEALNEGAAALLTKPFHPNELMKIVNQALLPHEEKWIKSWESEKLTNIKVDAESISQAQEMNLVKIGKMGFFLKRDPSGLRVGDKVEITLTRSAQKIMGCIRWIRAKSIDNLSEGMGIEILGLSESLQHEFIEINKNMNSVASIPIS